MASGVGTCMGHCWLDFRVPTEPMGHPFSLDSSCPLYGRQLLSGPQWAQLDDDIFGSEDHGRWKSSQRSAMQAKVNTVNILLGLFV